MKTQDLKAALLTFARQRPGLEYGNYNSASAYRADVRKATCQLYDARAIANAIPDTMPAHYLLDRLQNGGRLSLEGGRLTYIAGQYYCLEFRAAVAKALASALWDFWSDEMGPGKADAIRKRARAIFGRGIQSRYFD